MLWYLIDANYRLRAGTGLPIVNSETAGLLSLDGQGDVVAVIIAPGDPLTGQQRIGAASQNNFLNYLENDNADPAVDSNFISAND